MSFRDIFDETRRKIGGAIGNQVDNFRVGLNQNTLPSKIVKGAGEYLAGGAKRFGTSIGEAAYSPIYARQQKLAGQRALGEQRALENKLRTATSPIAKQRLQGAMKGYQTDFYNPQRDLGVLNKSNIRILGEAGQTAVDTLGVGGLKGLKGIQIAKPTTKLLVNTLGRGAEGAGYGALDALSRGGNKEDIIRSAKMGGAFGGVLGFASGAPLKALKYQKIASSMDSPIPSRYSEVQGAKLYKPNVKTVVQDIKDFAVKELGFNPKVNNYRMKGKVTKVLDPDTGKLISWSTDNPNFARNVQEGKLTMGMSTRSVKPSEDALSNEAKPDLYGARQRLEREASNLQEQIKPAIENAKKDAKGNMLPSEQKRIQALIDSWDNKLSEIKTINNTMESQLSPQSTQGATAEQIAAENFKKSFDATYNKGPARISVKTEGAKARELAQAQKANQIDDGLTARDFARMTDKELADYNASVLARKGISSTQGATPKIKLTEKPQLNTSKFNISEQAKTKLDETVAAIKPELEQVKGATLKNEEVVDAAKASKILSREVNPEATKKATAAVTRLRQEVAAGAEGKGLTKDFIENLKVLKSYSADAGRKLQAFNIKASPETSIKESIIADLVGLGKKSDDLIAAAKGVDFDNPKQVSKFYRQFVKPSLGEVLDEYRYINLLSSPQTHIVNAFSNLIQGTVLNPATKLYTGAIDSIGSTLTGKQRTAYMREVPAYSKGFINSMGEAFKEASEVMKGNKFVERPDINRLSTGKLGPGEYVMRALEAGDVFFRKMIKGGEMEALAYKASRSGKKIPKSVMEKQAADAAEYFVFRKAPDPTNKTGQGAVLSGIDKATEAVYKFRNVPGVKWVIPFVQTPMNILKQGLEYSPLGVSTMVGNTNKTQQLAKALIGSTVLAGAATLESTWDAPTSKNEKEEFYASGRKPYSVKIGDNWVSYSKLGPLAYPMAMAAAVKWYFENDPKATSTDSIDKTTKLLGGIAGFFSDQSYLSGIGDLVDVAKGEDYAIKGMLANFGKQLVPLTSLQGWVARQLDPIYRQPKTLMDQLKTGIPGLSKSVDSYKDPLGNDSVRQNNTFNSWSPVNVNPANQQFEDIYQKRQLQKRSDAEAKALTSGSKTLSDGRVAVVIDDEVKKFDSQQEADQAINKEKFKNSDKKAELIDGTYYYKKSDGDVGTYTEQEYNYKLRNAKMDIAYNKKDYKGWVQLANEKLKDIEKQYNEADPLTQQELLNDYQDLAAKIAKYSGYGGFTKGKSGGSGSKFTGITLPTTTAKIPIRQAKAPAFKNISKTPRIAIKTNKPKMISKSTLANMR
jgi:hypothetical protein